MRRLIWFIRNQVRALRQLQGWQRTLAIVFVVQLLSAVGFSIIFPFLPLYVEHLGSTTGLNTELMSGLVFSSQAMTMMIAGPIWGTLADRYGRKVMMQRATLGGALLLLLMAFVRSAEELVLLRAVQGVITGTVPAANALVAAEAPRERTGFAMGVVQLGMASGSAVGPLIGGALADAWGFRAPFVLTAILLAGAGVLVSLSIREHFLPSPRIIEQPINLFGGWRRVLAIHGVPVTYAVRFLGGLGGSMITPIAPLFIAVLFSAGVSAYAGRVAGVSILFPAEAGVSTYTGLVVGVAALATTVSAAYLGRLGDRIGHRPVLIGSALAAALSYLPQAAVGEAWQLLVLQALTGAASGGVVASASALLARYTQPGEEGTVYGLDNSVTAAARAIAPLAGSVMAVGLSLRSVFAIAGALYLLMALLAFRRLPQPAAVMTPAPVP